MVQQHTAFFYQRRLEEVNKRLDNITTPHIADIRTILNLIHFADIMDTQQLRDNKGSAAYISDVNIDFAEDNSPPNCSYMNNLPLNYVIFNRKLGLVYGHIVEKATEDETPKPTFNKRNFSNYSRFIADLITEKVVYASELKHFIVTDPYNHKYTVIKNDIDLLIHYPVEKKQRISDFLEVFEQLFEKYAPWDHSYKLQPFQISGTDWRLDIQSEQYLTQAPDEEELFADFYDVSKDSLNLDKAHDYIALIASDDSSKHNLMLLHAYVFKRKFNLVPAGKWFVMKDFGRTGKGLLMSTFSHITQKHAVEFENLTGTGFERSNEWANFYGADVIHANETGEITSKQMKEIRKIATGETVTARRIGKDNFTFKIEGVFILDTNNIVDIGGLIADTARTVKIALQDRQEDKEEERINLFAPYWEFMTHNGDPTQSKTEAALSFLINSVVYLSEVLVFNFEDTFFKNYYSSDQLTETQIYLIAAINKVGYVISGDETLKVLVAQDYGNLRTAKAQKDLRAIGVATNRQKKIEGQKFRVHTVGDEALFVEATKMISQNESKEG